MFSALGALVALQLMFDNDNDDDDELRRALSMSVKFVLEFAHREMRI